MGKVSVSLNASLRLFADVPTINNSGTVRSGGSSTISLPSVMSWGSSSPSSNATLTEQWSHVVNNWDNYAKKRSYVSVS